MHDAAEACVVHADLVEPAWRLVTLGSPIGLPLGEAHTCADPCSYRALANVHLAEAASIGRHETSQEQSLCRIQLFQI